MFIMDSAASPALAAAHHFPATLWSRVLRTRHEPTSHAALDQLCSIYWQPVLGYIKALGCAHDDAEDVAQEFFRTFLGRDGFQRAEQDRGTLRSYLKAAIRHHLQHWRRHQQALRRGGGTHAVELDAEDSPELPSPAGAEDRYDEKWALTVMERALAELKAGYARRHKLPLYEQLKVTLTSPESADLSSLAAKLGISRGAFAVEQHRARRRLADLLRSEVAQTVSDPSEIDDELMHLMRVLAQTEVQPL
jgi:RNA polymerase sigma-70 factor (ECF subfamily)